MGGFVNQATIKSVPVPTPAAGELLVKIDFFAANPTDVIHLDYIGTAGSIIGCDFAGTVVQAGSSTSRHKVGDRIFSAIHGGKYANIGSAAEYCVVGDDLAMSIPEGMSGEDAVTFGVGFLTAAATLYDTQEVPLPPAKITEEAWYFVSGGATSVGGFAIQLAHLAGFKVIASASPHSFDLVKSYGADHVVSYADHPAALKEIREITNGGVVKGIDCVGGKANIRFAVDAFGPNGGMLTSILPGGKSHRKDVKLEDLLLYRYLGKAFTFIPVIMTFPAEPEKRKFLADFTGRATDIIEKNKIKGTPVDLNKGLEACPAGWDRLRKKKVSGKKLVFDLRN